MTSLIYLDWLPNNNCSSGMMWHWFRANELLELAESQGLITIEMAGCQGLSTGLPEATNRLRDDDDKWQAWVKIVLDTASEPAVVDMADHILYLGRKAG
jgi:hypothetical protein